MRMLHIKNTLVEKPILDTEQHHFPDEILSHIERVGAVGKEIIVTLYEVPFVLIYLAEHEDVQYQTPGPKRAQ